MSYCVKVKLGKIKLTVICEVKTVLTFLSLSCHVCRYACGTGRDSDLHVK